MKKMFIAMAAMFILVGCGEAPTATIEPEGTENIIVENTITENVITEKLTWEEAKELYYHPYWEDQNNDSLFHEWRNKYDEFNENDYTERQIWQLRFMTDELSTRVESDGYVYLYDIYDEDLEHVKALCNPTILVSKEYLDTLSWNLHDIYEYGNTLR